MSPSSSGDKPAQTGLVDMGYIGFYDAPGLPTTNPPTNYEGPDPTFNLSDLANFTGSFSEVVLNLTWAQLQPTQSGPIDYAIIQDAIKTVTAYNIANGTDLGIKLRVWGGSRHPTGPRISTASPSLSAGRTRRSGSLQRPDDRSLLDRRLRRCLDQPTERAGYPV